MGMTDALITLLAIGGDPKSLSEVQYLVVMSALLRGDRQTARQFLNDWGKLPERPITRYIPGNHFYALGIRFNTYDEAKGHLLNEGFGCSGVRYTYVDKSNA